jgi:hypothetical protein
MLKVKGTAMIVSSQVAMLKVDLRFVLKERMEVERVQTI